MINRKFLYCLVFLVAACDVVPVEEVEIRFRQDHPEATSVSIGPGEGDSDNVYFLINYREDGLEKSEVRLYQKNKDNEWQLTIVE